MDLRAKAGFGHYYWIPGGALAPSFGQGCADHGVLVCAGSFSCSGASKSSTRCSFSSVSVIVKLSGGKLAD